MTAYYRTALGGVAFGATVLLAQPALAAPCAELNLKNPVYGAGGSAITATLSKVAAVTRREALVVSWYTTAGELSLRRTGQAGSAAQSSTRWTAPSRPGAARLWAVLRDDRGGVGYREVDVQVD